MQKKNTRLKNEIDKILNDIILVILSRHDYIRKRDKIRLEINNKITKKCKYVKSEKYSRKTRISTSKSKDFAIVIRN